MTKTTSRLTPLSNKLLLLAHANSLSPNTTHMWLKRPSSSHTEPSEQPLPKKIKKSHHITEDTPLQFFSKSKDPEARQLSNFAESWIEIDGRWYPTVEHYYQSQKYFPKYPSIAATFSSVAKGGIPEVGIEAKAAKSAGSKTAMKKKKIVLDTSKWSIEGPIVMENALRAKFDIPFFQLVLQKTGSRPLHHFERRPGLWGMHTNKITGEVKGSNLMGALLEKIRSESTCFAKDKDLLDNLSEASI